MLQGASKMMRKKESVKFMIRVKFENKILKERISSIKTERIHEPLIKGKSADSKHLSVSVSFSIPVITLISALCCIRMDLE